MSHYTRARSRFVSRLKDPQPPTSRREAKREAILRAACQAIAERGIDRVRMSDVAAAAGVSATLPHYYFNTLSELLREAFVYADDALIELEQIAGEGHPPVEKLERMLVIYLSRDPGVYESWMLWREMTTRAILEPGLRDSHEEIYLSWIATMAGVVREGQAAGAIGAGIDADRVAWRLTALVDGLGPRLLSGMATRAQCCDLVHEAIAVELHLKGSA